MLTKEQQAVLDALCKDAFERLDNMRDRMDTLGLYMGPRREPYQSRQAPLSFGGPPKPNGKGPSPLTVDRPSGPVVFPPSPEKVNAR